MDLFTILDTDSRDALVHRLLLPELTPSRGCDILAQGVGGSDVRTAVLAMARVSRSVREWWCGARAWQDICMRCGFHYQHEAPPSNWFSLFQLFTAPRTALIPDTLFSRHGDSKTHDPSGLRVHLTGIAEDAHPRRAAPLLPATPTRPHAVAFEHMYGVTSGANALVKSAVPCYAVSELLPLQTDRVAILAYLSRVFVEVKHSSLSTAYEGEDSSKRFASLTQCLERNFYVTAPGYDGSTAILLSELPARPLSLESPSRRMRRRRRTGMFYCAPPFEKEREPFITLARSLVWLWDERGTEAWSGTSSYYRDRATDDFTLRASLSHPGLPELQDFIYQCIMDPNDPAFPKLAAEAYLGRLERHRFLATAVAPSRFVLPAPSDAEPAVAKAEADRDGSGERSEEHFETEHEAALLRELSSPGAKQRLDGFAVHPSFVTEKEAMLVLAGIEGGAWTTVAHERRVQVFGHNYIDGTQASLPLPEWAAFIVRRANDRLDGIDGEFSELIVTEYAPGDELAPHIDRMLWGPVVLGLSLLGACDLELTHALTGAVAHRVRLAGRSLYVMGGSSRTHYRHAVKNISARRISLTFRALAGEQPQRRCIVQ